MKANPTKTGASAAKANRPFFSREGVQDFFARDRKPEGFFTAHRGVAGAMGGMIQPKLRIGQPHDHYEREADSMADKVVQRLSMPATPASEQVAKTPTPIGPVAQLTPISRVPSTAAAPAVQEKCAHCEQEDKKKEKEEEKGGHKEKIRKKPIFAGGGEPPEDSIQRKCAACAKEEQLQKKSTGNESPGVTAPVESSLRASNGAGRPLAPDLRSRLEPAFGADFSGVRIHDNSRAVQLSRQLDAQAFTHRNNIYFNSGKYAPESRSGQQLLAHELTHVVQQGAAGESVQRMPSLSDIGDTLSDAYDSAKQTAQGVGSTIYQAGSDAVDTVSQGVSSAGHALYQAGSTAVSAVGGAVSDAVDWLSTEAGKVAQALVSSLGGTLTITSAGIEISVPKFCPLDAHAFSFNLPSLSKKLMAPLFKIPIPPDIIISGEIGLAGTIAPAMQIQVGPFCMNGVHILINPLTNHYSISGSLSATTAASLEAELRGGLRGELNLTAIVPIGPVPVPITIPVLGAEGGLAGKVRGIGAQTVTFGGSLDFSGGIISSSQFANFDMGLAADLFAGAYAELDVLGKNICRIYWQPWEWHGGMASSLHLSAGLTLIPGGRPSIIPTLDPPTLDAIPFDQIPLAINRKGFKDDCPLIDRVCEILKALKLLPSQNGGKWNPSGPYGPGKRLPGPLEVYERNPHIPSGALCRGACGVDCKTCDQTKTYIYVDPVTGERWEYTLFEDCNSNDGCREHDAAFDWAADVKGEKGKFAIIMPWHLSASVECACNNLAGNCLAWIIGLPPYDGKLYFAESAKPLPKILPPPPPHGGGGGIGPSSTTPIGRHGPDFYHYSPAPPTGDFRKGTERWTDYYTNCQAEAQAATGIPSAPRYVTTLSKADAPPYIDETKFSTRRFSSFIHGILITVQHYKNYAVIPAAKFTSTPLTILGPNCSGTGPSVKTGNEEEDLENCDKKLLPETYCNELYDRVIKRFGNKHRDLNFDPDKELKTGPSRPEDAPVLDSFRRLYNRLDSWQLFIHHKHPDLTGEFDSKFKVNDNRDLWMDELKKKVKAYKGQFRDLKNKDTDSLQRDFEAKVLLEIQGRIDKLVREIAEWYKLKTGSTEDIDTIIEKVHQEGTEIWRKAWREDILAVNRILSRLWPPAKSRIITWVIQERKIHPGVDLSGDVGDLDYIGSLATGFKGPPKQNIRFNPDSFDVDANLEAPPLAKFAMSIDGKTPDRGRIFAKLHGTTITPLIEFCDTADQQLKSIAGYKKDDPFDVAIQAPETPGQERGRKGTERIYALRKSLGDARYRQLLADLEAAGLLVDKEGGRQLPEDLSEEQNDKLNKILSKYES